MSDAEVRLTMAMKPDPDARGFILIGNELCSFHGVSLHTLHHVNPVPPWRRRRLRSWWKLRSAWRRAGWSIVDRWPDEKDATTWAHTTSDHGEDE